MTAIQTIDAALGRYARKCRRLAAVRLLLGTTATVGAGLLMAMAIDRRVPTPAGFRWATLVAAAVAIGAAVARSAVRATRRVDALAAARAAEADDPAWGERLSTVVTQARLPAAVRGSTALNGALAAEVAERVNARPPAGRARLRSAWPAGAAVMAVAAAWAGTAAVPATRLPRLLARQLRPWASVQPATGTRIELAALPADVAQGRPLTITATLAGGDGAGDAARRARRGAPAFDRHAAGRRPALRGDAAGGAGRPCLPRDVRRRGGGAGVGGRAADAGRNGDRPHAHVRRRPPAADEAGGRRPAARAGGDARRRAVRDDRARGATRRSASAT